MLEKYGVTCDDCGGYHHLQNRVFSQKIQELKDDGWKIRKHDDLWCHYCPDCEPPKPIRPVHQHQQWWHE